MEIGDRGTRYEHEERETKKLGANLALSVIPYSFLFCFSIFIFPFPVLDPHSRFSIPGSSLSASSFSKLKSNNKAQDKVFNASQNSALKIIFEHSTSVEYCIPFIKFDNKKWNMYDYHPNAFILTTAVHVIKFKMIRLFLIKGKPYSNSENQRSRRSGENKGKAYMRDALISRSEKNLHDCKIANLVITTDTTTFEALNNVFFKRRNSRSLLLVPPGIY